MRKNIILLVAAFLTATAWYRILFQTFTGEGYYYFFNEMRETFFRYDVGAFLFFDFLGPIFKDNFFFYQLIALISLTAIVILFYFIVYEITYRKSAALIASVVFGVNYNSIFEMIAIGAYQNFVQRILFLVILFPSFLLFIKFIKNKKISYYITSLILAILSVGLAYFNFFYILFLITYLAGFLLTKKVRIKKIIFLSSFTLIYVLISFLILNIPKILGIFNMMPRQSFLMFLSKNINEVSINFFKQLTILSVPDVVLRIFFSFFNISIVQAVYYNNGIQYLYAPVSLIYIFAGIFLYKREGKLRPVIIACLLFLPLIFILNLYTRADHVSRLETGSRYLFVPSFAYSIFWGIFLASFLKRKSKVRFFVYSIILVWIVIQLIAINRQLKAEEYNHIATKKIISYFKNNLSQKLKEDSIVITPYTMGNWGSDFLNKFYGKKNTVFVPRMDPQFEWKAEFKRAFDPKKDFIIYYDENSQKVTDITKDYKNIIKTVK